MHEKSIFLVRHGQTRLNKEHRFLGSTNAPLNALGRKQARAIRKTLRKEKVERVYTSPLKRALQTAEICFPGTYAIKPCLRERDFGTLEGKTRQEGIDFFRPLFPKEHFPEHGWMFVDCCLGVNGMGGEHRHALQARVKKCFSQICSLKARKIAVFTHAIWIKTLLEQLGLYTDGFEIGTGEILRLDLKGKQAEICPVQK